MMKRWKDKDPPSLFTLLEVSNSAS